MMWTVVVIALALAVVYLGMRVRSLSHRLEELGDRAIDWRIKLARAQEELSSEVERLRLHAGLPAASSARGMAPPPGADALLQIRKRT